MSNKSSKPISFVGVPTKLMGLPDWYIEQGPQDLLRERYGLTAEGIYEATKALVMQTPSRVGAYR